MDSSPGPMSSGSASRARSRTVRSTRKHSRTLAESVVKTASVMRPRTRRALNCGSASSTPCTASGSRPYFCCSADVLTWMYTSIPRPAACSLRSRASATRSESRAWNSAANAATSRALFRWRCPMTAQSTSRSDISPCFRTASWTLFSPSCVQPAATASLMRSCGTVLLTGRSLTARPSRPLRVAAASIRARTSARLAAKSSTVSAVGYAEC